MRGLVFALVVVLVPATALARPDDPRPIPRPERPRPLAPKRLGPPSQHAAPGSPRSIVRDAPVDATIRRGFTASIDLGYGLTVLAPEMEDAFVSHGLAGLDLAAGAWLSSRAAVLLRVSGTTTKTRDGTMIVGAFVGPSGQLVLGRDTFVGAGIGAAVRATSADDVALDAGLGLDLRVGFELEQTRDYTIYVACEVTPGWYDDGMVTGIGLQLGFQAM